MLTNDERWLCEVCDCDIRRTSGLDPEASMYQCSRCDNMLWLEAEDSEAAP